MFTVVLASLCSGGRGGEILDPPLGYDVRFLRENLDTAWDRTSLQRLSCRLPTNLSLLSSERQSATTWRLRFSDGAAGLFTMPPGKEGAMLQAMPRALWGGRMGRDVRGVEADLVNESDALRFSVDALMGRNSTELCCSKASEQLGQGRAALARETAALRMRLFEAVHRFGMAIIEGAPAEADAGRLLADALVGAVETTVFGYTFVIRRVADAHNLAFDDIALQQHTDFTYLQKVPDVALFHCIQNAESGGESLWADGFALAEELRATDPRAFDLLATTPVLFVDITDKWLLEATHPTIELADDGVTIKRIHFNERTRDSWRQWRPASSERVDAVPHAGASNEHQHAGLRQRIGQSGLAWEEEESQPVAVSAAFYDALRKYEALADAAHWHVTTPLRPGDVALFDNARVMHSRTSFTGERHMEGSYISWEATEATWRALQWQAERSPYKYCGRTVGGGKIS